MYYPNLINLGIYRVSSHLRFQLIEFIIILKFNNLNYKFYIMLLNI
jgi:hypothetical protein